MGEIVTDLTAQATAVSATPGDTLALRIIENPTTGYGWRRVAPLPDGVVELPSTFIQDKPAPGSVGADDIMTGTGGTRVFHYRCDRATSGEFIFQLFPPGNQNNAVEGRRVTFTCR